jgi:predicted nucleic acid-binding protein
VRWLIDTNVWIEAANGSPHAVRALQEGTKVEWAGFSAITRVELFGYPDLTSEEAEILKEILAPFYEVPVTSDVIDAAIIIRSQVSVRVPDAIIAASCKVLGAGLVTRDIKGLRRIPGLTIVDPAQL